MLRFAIVFAVLGVGRGWDGKGYFFLRNDKKNMIGCDTEKNVLTTTCLFFGASPKRQMQAFQPNGSQTRFKRSPTKKNIKRETVTIGGQSWINLG